MAVGERELIYSSQMSYTGIFSFSDFYQFCYDWLTDEPGLKVIENKYKEKLAGDAKDIEIEWTGKKEVTDYFKFEVKVTMKVYGLKKVQITKGNAKIDTNKGQVKMTVKGSLLRDYKGKFEISAFKKFLRGIYEKWVINTRIDQLEDKLTEVADEFLLQAKSYLDLEGKK